jgi:hypothetical protein
MNSRALLLRENKWEVLMKVLGAKLPDHEFEKYLELCEKAGITKSDFARLSFKFFYLSIMSTNAKKIWLFNADRWGSRAIIFRCSDESYLRILDLIRNSPDCFLVFSKSSNLKLVVQEEGW